MIVWMKLLHTHPVCGAVRRAWYTVLVRASKHSGIERCNVRIYPGCHRTGKAVQIRKSVEHHRIEVVTSNYGVSFNNVIGIFFWYCTTFFFSVM